MITTTCLILWMPELPLDAWAGAGAPTPTPAVDRDEGHHAGETGDPGRNHKGNLADSDAGIVKPTSELREVNRLAADHV